MDASGKNAANWVLERTGACRIICSILQCTLDEYVSKPVLFRLAQSEVSVRPKEIFKAWVQAFNEADADKLAEFYAENAVNHQAANEPIAGRKAIHEM